MLIGRVSNQEFPHPVGMTNHLAAIQGNLGVKLFIIGLLMFALGIILNAVSYLL